MAEKDSKQYKYRQEIQQVSRISLCPSSGHLGGRSFSSSAHPAKVGKALAARYGDMKALCLGIITL